MAFWRYKLLSLMPRLAFKLVNASLNCSRFFDAITAKLIAYS